MLINYHTTKCSICSTRFKRQQWRVAVDVGLSAHTAIIATCEACSNRIYGKRKVRYNTHPSSNALTLPTDTHK